MTARRRIDVHSHFVPEWFPDRPALSSCSCWPRNIEAPSGRSILFGSKPFRALDERCWNPELRVAAMLADNVDAQVLSPMPELLSHWMTAEDALALARHVNDELCRFTAYSPKQFCALGMIPMQDVRLAISELNRLRFELGFAGIEVGASMAGSAFADPRFHPIYAEAERLDMAVLVHPVRTAISELLGAEDWLLPVVGYPLDQALAVASAMMNQLPDRFPQLRVAFTHGGGAYFAVHPRLIKAWASVPALQNRRGSTPAVSLQHLYFDLLTYDERLHRLLRETVGEERLLIGSDFPFAIRQPNPGVFDDTADTTEDWQLKVDTLNPARFLGVDPATLQRNA